MPLNHAKCADLHNQLLRVGWQAAGKPLDNSSLQPSWTSLQDDHQQLQAVLTDETIAFYKSALVPCHGPDSDDAYQNLFYFASGLANPIAEFNRSATQLLSTTERNRYIVLYSMSALGSGHRVGVLLDQKTGNAIMQPDLFSYDASTVDLPWKPLEDILSSWLDMVKVRKVVAGNYQTNTTSSFGLAPPQHPWKMLSYSQDIVRITLEAYQELIQAIENRMPYDEEAERPSEPLATEDVLNQGNFPKKCFAREFLTNARRPVKCRYIAPGIALPTEETLKDQPFKELAKQHPHVTPNAALYLGRSISEDEDPLYPPLLLFPAKTNGSQVQTTLPSDPAHSDTFLWPFNSLRDIPAGLYLDMSHPWSETPYEDASLLILPFAIGGAADHAEYNDSTHIRRPSQTDLYQTSINPFVPGHRTQLHLIFDSWRKTVENGHWRVDDEGVSEGIEKFQESDQSSDMARKYTAALHW